MSHKKTNIKLNISGITYEIQSGKSFSVTANGLQVAGIVLPLIRRLIFPYEFETVKRFSIAEASSVVTDELHNYYTFTDIFNRSRFTEQRQARQIYFYLMRTVFNYTINELKRFSGYHHSTIHHSINVIGGEIESYETMNRRISDMKLAVSNKLIQTNKIDEW